MSWFVRGSERFTEVENALKGLTLEQAQQLKSQLDLEKIEDQNRRFSTYENNSKRVNVIIVDGKIESVASFG